MLEAPVTVENLCVVRRREDDSTVTASEIAAALVRHRLAAGTADGVQVSVPGVLFASMLVDSDGHVLVIDDGDVRPGPRVDQAARILAQDLAATVIDDTGTFVMFSDGIAVDLDAPHEGTDGGTHGGTAEVAARARTVVDDASRLEGSVIVHALRSNDLIQVREGAAALDAPVEAFVLGPWSVAREPADHPGVWPDDALLRSDLPAWSLIRRGRGRMLQAHVLVGRKRLDFVVRLDPGSVPADPDLDPRWVTLLGESTHLEVQRGELDPDREQRLLEAASGPAETFFERLATVLDIPREAIDWVEGRLPADVEVRSIEPRSLLGQMRDTVADEVFEPSGTGPMARYQRWVNQRPGLMINFGLLELVLSFVLILGTFWDFPTWLRWVVAIGLMFDGTGNVVLGSAIRKRRRAA